MLKTLYIENIAVIEKTSIDFSGGLNVLTGETGAGKSIIIDAINAIMGQRTSRDIIRTGEKTAFVSALFEDVNPT
ncbi:MAG: AAA family ATPase, partial [Ruminococcus sp.]|nr:AAA family ATPase [Ruminococcus sp.]